MSVARIRSIDFDNVGIADDYEREVQESGVSNSFEITNDYASKSLDLEISYMDGDGHLEVIITDFTEDILWDFQEWG